MRELNARPQLRVVAAAMLTTLALLTSGCGKSPTAPVAASEPPPPAPEYTEVTIAFETVLCVHDGDSFPFDRGDFSFYVKADQSTHHWDYNSNPTASWDRLIGLNDGNVHTMNKSVKFVVRNDVHSPISFLVQAEEWDLDLLLRPVPDLGLGNAFRTIVLPNDSRRYNIGLIKVTMGNSECQVEYRVRVTSRPVP